GGLEGFRDVYIARSALGGKVTIGHFKPYRSMEELTSSNEILMMERPFASATGLFSGRQFQQGVGYLRGGGRYTAGFSVFNLRGASGPRNEGMGYAGRVTFAPVNDGDNTLHFGAWGSHENANKGSADLRASAGYAGRRGPSQTIATVTGTSGDEVTAWGVEAAGAFGPLFFQGEYANASFGQPLGPDHDVTAWYLQGSWHLNGGHKPYQAGTGVFGSAPVADRGLWELTARYDSIENRDVAGLEVSSWILGMNYYVNPNLRFMFNYTRGDNGLTGDETGQYAVRAQFAWKASRRPRRSLFVLVERGEPHRPRGLLRVAPAGVDRAPLPFAEPGAKQRRAFLVRQAAFHHQRPPAPGGRLARQGRDAVGHRGARGEAEIGDVQHVAVAAAYEPGHGLRVGCAAQVQEAEGGQRVVGEAPFERGPVAHAFEHARPRPARVHQVQGPFAPLRVQGAAVQVAQPVAQRERGVDGAPEQGRERPGQAAFEVGRVAQGADVEHHVAEVHVAEPLHHRHRIGVGEPVHQVALGQRTVARRALQLHGRAQGA